MHRAHEAARYPCLPPIAREKMSMLQSRFVSMTLGVAALLAPLLADARQAQQATMAMQNYLFSPLEAVHACGLNVG